ncbi:hypothetical protein [Xenophilus sp. Marseille-Q4582]|uniref:hypothetical protein n=1 Tax=Xenophilus sp. Marseille-Q4582 TaxID=2866600 RepID=UPI001CE3F3AB|nr:hypothetical protein [Xenophilus sp. Marseille-Q4582]
MRKSMIIAAVALGLAGCASKTGIVPIGDGLYMASNMDYMAWSSGGIKAELFKEANEFCSKQGKALKPVNSKGEDATLSGRYASAEVQFRCE